MRTSGARDGVPGFVGTISDFTDLVSVRGNLRKAESLFLNTFDQAPIGIAFADRSGRIQRSNPAFCTLLGIDVDDLTNRYLRRPYPRRGPCGQLQRDREPMERRG